MLQALRTRGIRIGVISNTMYSGATIAAALSRAELGSMVELVVTSADYGIQKPHHAIFAAALGRLGIPADQAWFAGDSLRADIGGASSAGLRAIWYARKSQDIAAALSRHSGPRPAAVIRNWDELMGLMPTC